MLLRKYNGHIYRVYTPEDSKSDHPGCIIAEANFAKKCVKGIAKCHPLDTMNSEDGIKLAILRCAQAIANKRVKWASKLQRKRMTEVMEAKRCFDKSTSYYLSAFSEERKIKSELNELLKKLK